jgi:predicted PurR-regulated permease PerM
VDQGRPWPVSPIHRTTGKGRQRVKEPRIIDQDGHEVGVDPPRTREHITISVSARTIAIVFGLMLVVWIVRELSSTLVIFAGAMLLATAIDKPASAMVRHRVPRGVAILIIFAAIVALLALIVSLLIPLITDEAKQLAKDLPDYQQQVEDILRRLHIGNGGGTAISLDSVTEQLSGNLQLIATHLTDITLEIGHTAIVLFVTLVIAFMMGMHPTSASDYVARFLTPDANARLRRITADIDHRIGTWVRGQVLVAISFGLLFGLGLWAIGIPFAASIALTAAVLEVIPYLGGAVTLIISVLVAFSIGLPEVVLVIILYVILINIESHILAPLLIGDAVGLPSMVVLAALFVGLETKGIIGVLLAVPTVLVIAAILDEFWPGPERTGPTNAMERMGGWAARVTRQIVRPITAPLPEPAATPQEDRPDPPPPA